MILLMVIIILLPFTSKDLDLVVCHVSSYRHEFNKLMLRSIYIRIACLGI